MSQTDKERQWNSYKGQTSGVTAPPKDVKVDNALQAALSTNSPREAKTAFLNVMRKRFQDGKIDNKQWRQYKEAAYSTYADTVDEYVENLSSELSLGYIPPYTADKSNDAEAEQIAKQFQESQVKKEKTSFLDKAKAFGKKIEQPLLKAGFHKDDIKRAGILFTALLPAPVPGIATIAAPTFLLGSTAFRKLKKMYTAFKGKKANMANINDTDDMAAYGKEAEDELQSFIEFIMQPEVKQILQEIDISELEKAEFAKQPEKSDIFLNRLSNRIKKAQPEIDKKIFEKVNTLKQLRALLENPEKRNVLLRTLTDTILGLYAIVDVEARKTVGAYIDDLNKAQFANPLYAVIEKLPEFNVTSKAALDYWNDTGGFDFLSDYYWEKGYIDATNIADNITETINQYIQKGYPDKEVLAKVKAQHGAHTQTVIRTNLNTAFNQGRMDELRRNPDMFPLFVYRSVGDARSRPSHKYLDRMVFASDDELLELITPANGFNCRCGLDPINKFQKGEQWVKDGKAKRRQLDLTKIQDIIDFKRGA